MKLAEANTRLCFQLLNKHMAKMRKLEATIRTYSVDIAICKQYVDLCEKHGAKPPRAKLKALVEKKKRARVELEGLQLYCV